MATSIPNSCGLASPTQVTLPKQAENPTTTAALTALKEGAAARNQASESKLPPSFIASQSQSGGAAASTQVEPSKYYSSDGIKNPHEIPTVRQLFDRYNCCWYEKEYLGLPYSQAEAVNLLKAHNTQFTDWKVAPNSFGVLRKKIVPVGTQIFVRADLHGDLKSLMANLWTLREKSLLDDNFKCKEGIQLVFLGNYINHGVYGMPIMMLLAALQIENPDQVTLIRGSDEYLERSLAFCDADKPLTDFWSTNEPILTRFCETMPLSLYVATEHKGPLEFIQFTHGTVEPHLDLTRLLDGSVDQMDVPKEITKAPARIREILINSPLYEAAKRVSEICVLSQKVRSDPSEAGLSVFNCGNMDERTQIRSLGKGSYCFSPQDLYYLFRVSSEKNRVHMMFRGHQYVGTHWTVRKTGAEKVVATTLPVGADSPIPGGSDEDRVYLLTTAPQAEAWTKSAFRREAQNSQVEESRLKSTLLLKSCFGPLLAAFVTI